MDSPAAVQDLENLQEHGFVGVSKMTPGDLRRYRPASGAGSNSGLGSLVLNSQEDAWTSWQPILEQFPQLRLLVSHLGLPPVGASSPSREQATNAMRQITELSKYARVRVKLSGFYSLALPGHDYRHEAAWPVCEDAGRSLFLRPLAVGLDFSPCLNWITFPQTVDIFNKMPFLSQGVVAKITGRNLLRASGLIGAFDKTPDS
jgi:hypothetical protein